jgi:alpha-beta hydrolase superfamily lysophospholipase
VHEDLLVDLAAAVRWLRERRGVEKVVLLGNSGGGSLAAFYQAQAKRAPDARLAATPAGGPTKLPGATMIPADALVLVAAHPGQGHVLGQCIDPSLVDERDPLSVDVELDMYDGANGFRPPPEWSEYDDAFLARYRDAQRVRVARLDFVAREYASAAAEAAARVGAPDFASLPAREQKRIARRAAFEPVMVVYRTMANPAYVDRRIHPSSREYGSLLSDRPDLMNYQRLGFARTVTPRAWLSTWSGLSSNAVLATNLSDVDEPTLFVHAGRDREVYRPEVDAAFEALASPDKTFRELVHARHYFEPDLGAPAAPERDHLMAAVVGWLDERFR